MQRRTFLKNTLAASATGVAVSAGLLTPSVVLAKYPKAAFESKDFDAAVSAIAGGKPEASGDITIKAPDIAENGAVVPVTVSTGAAGVSLISVLAPNNPVPLLASFNLSEGAQAYVSTRIKMGKTGDVVAVVKMGDKLVSNQKEVKVTIGGCGG